MKMEYSFFKDWLIPAAFITALFAAFGIHAYFSIELIEQAAQISQFAAGSTFTIIAAVWFLLLRMIFWCVEEWNNLTKINILRGLTTNQFLAALGPLMLILFASGWAIAALTTLAIWAYSLGGDIINPTITFVYPTLWLIWGTTFSLIAELIQEQIWPKD